MAGGGATVRGSIRKAEIRHGKTLMRGKSLAFNTHWPATDTSRGAPCGPALTAGAIVLRGPPPAGQRAFLILDGTTLLQPV
ncbi:hypothetical protein BCAR13_310025 [Paraburkholderia caribensis]|nr:hypothetical protein BCAR13_310025 [Paraburkholderia caribensis]